MLPGVSASGSFLLLPTSSPPWPNPCSGPAIVAGRAWCLLEDVERATRIFGNLPVIGVNGAAEHLDLFALFSLHRSDLATWAAVQTKKFGPGFTTHSISKPEIVEKRREKYPHVDYWWDSYAKGSSGWAARKVAAGMGFGPVILCGIPMEVGGYQNGKIAKMMVKQDVIDHYRNMILEDAPWHAGAFSMSGWTRDLLGDGSHGGR